MEHFAKILLGISANERTNEKKEKRKKQQNNKATKFKLNNLNESVETFCCPLIRI